MLKCRLLPYLPLSVRSKHNSSLLKTLKNPSRAVKMARDAKNQQVKEARENPIPYSKFPKQFFRKTQVNSNNSHSLYLVNNETATKIAQHLTKSVDLNKTFVETNPGEGLLTKLLIESGVTDLRLYEAIPEFVKDLQETYAQVHPDRVKLKHFDLVGVNRSIYFDQMSGGTRSAVVLSELPSTEWETDTNFTLFGATGSNSFFWHLIHSIVLQYSILALGRCECYMVMPSVVYMTLASSNCSAYTHYRPLSILFQIFFEYQLLDKYPREHFLPHLTNSKRVGSTSDRLRHNIRGPQFNTVDPELMYFVKIVPRRDLHKWCPPNQIQELWHFIVLHCYSRQNRIIPLLEKFIPGIGTRLLINFGTKKPERSKRIHKVDTIETPPTTNVAMTLSDRDYYENLNIYTQFGDLQPMQLFTLFREFRMMSEYWTCGFLPSLEKTLLMKNIKSD